MRKIILPVVAACLMVSACSKGPKETVIPTDPKQWSDIKPSIEKLDPADKQLIGKYMVRVGIGGAFTGQSIPPGTTIGQAIEDEKKFEAGNGQ